VSFRNLPDEHGGNASTGGQSSDDWDTSHFETCQQLHAVGNERGHRFSQRLEECRATLELVPVEVAVRRPARSNGRSFTQANPPVSGLATGVGYCLCDLVARLALLTRLTVLEALEYLVLARGE